MIHYHLFLIYSSKASRRGKPEKMSGIKAGGISQIQMGFPVLFKISPLSAR
jgi:hypothetical protein